MDIRELNHHAVLSLLPDRDPWGHKGDFGKLLLICGSVGFTGAAWFSAMGALRCGAGLVFLGVPESIYSIEAVKLNEPIVFPLPDKNGKLSEAAIPEILERISGVDTVLIGCGLGQSEGAWAVTKAVLEHAECPVVLDADGINLIAHHMDVLRRRKNVTVLTPHAGEFRRMTNMELGDPQNSAASFAREYGCILVLKGHRTCISDGYIHYRNITGNPGMAVGGSGDILAGMITALIGQGVAPLEAAACGAWLHGAAGDLCAQEMGQYGMLPSDLLEKLLRLMK